MLVGERKYVRAFNNTLQLCVQCEIIRLTRAGQRSLCQPCLLTVRVTIETLIPPSALWVLGRITSRHFGAVCVTSVSDGEEQRVISVSYITYTVTQEKK